MKEDKQTIDNWLTDPIEDVEEVPQNEVGNVSVSSPPSEETEEARNWYDSPFAQHTTNAYKMVKPYTDKMGSLPTPGGISLMVLILVVLLLVIVPVGSSGETRWQLMWAVLGNGNNVHLGTPPPTNHHVNNPSSTPVTRSVNSNASLPKGYGGTISFPGSYKISGNPFSGAGS